MLWHDHITKFMAIQSNSQPEVHPWPPAFLIAKITIWALYLILREWSALLPFANRRIETKKDHRRDGRAVHAQPLIRPEKLRRVHILKNNLLDLFDQRAQHYALLSQFVSDQIRERDALSDCAIHSISHRIKTSESLKRKLERPDRIYHHLSEITDILGFRIVTYFHDGIEEVAKFVESRFDVNWSKSIDKRQKDSLDQFGYRSLHYICRAPDTFFESFNLTPIKEFCFEIQIRTILEHAWAEIEHDLGYKADHDVPAEIRRRFSRLSGLLELADQEFVDIKKSLNQYQARVAEKIAGEEHDVTINRVSLRAALESGITNILDNTLAQRLSLPKAKTFFYIDYLIRMLDLIGVKTISQLSQIIELHAPHLEPFIPEYFAFTKHVWGFSGSDIGEVKTGYGLLFIAHLHFLHVSELDVERLEQLTRFYAQLDFSHQSDEAKSVAVAFLENVSRTKAALE